MWGKVVPALLGVAGSAAVAMAAEPGRTEANVKSKNDASEIEVSVEASWASSYIYRGVSLSGRQPSVGSHLELSRDLFYASLEFNSVKVPTNPADEVTLAAGIRRTIGNTTLDLGVSYFHYPREIQLPGMVVSNYGEAAFGISHALADGFELEGQLAYSPSVSNTGAWGAYAYGMLTYDLPKLTFLDEVGWSVSGGVGYWRFGTTNSSLGGFALPTYAHWDAGVTFDYKKILKLDVRYHNTSLSSEDCFVFTGDPGAMLGGAMDPIRNPDGLRSRFCGPALVGKLSFEYPRRYRPQRIQRPAPASLLTSSVSFARSAAAPE